MDERESCERAVSWTAWQQNAVDCLREISDTELQKRAWLEKEAMEFPCPVELVCQLFDDTGLDDALEAGEVFFSPECDSLLRELGREVDAVQLDQPVSSLLKDDAWRKVATMAEVALRRIEAYGSGVSD